jgi:hypothetical protein
MIKYVLGFCFDITETEVPKELVVEMMRFGEFLKG